MWTFAGDKINRTISFLLKKERLGKVLEDYQKIEISFSKKSEIGVHDIINFLKAQSAKSISEFTSDFKTDAKSIKFSKFSICLPDQLSEEAIFDRALDISGTLQILKSISFKLLADD